MYKGSTINTDGVWGEVEYNESNTLQKLQEAVDGYIELVDLGNGKLLVVDEEGLCKDKPFNQVASMLCNRHIVGNAVVVDNESIK